MVEPINNYGEGHNSGTKVNSKKYWEVADTKWYNGDLVLKSLKKEFKIRCSDGDNLNKSNFEFGKDGTIKIKKDAVKYLGKDSTIYDTKTGNYLPIFVQNNRRISVKLTNGKLIALEEFLNNPSRAMYKAKHSPSEENVSNTAEKILAVPFGLTSCTRRDDVDAVSAGVTFTDEDAAKLLTEYFNANEGFDGYKHETKDGVHFDFTYKVENGKVTPQIDFGNGFVLDIDNYNKLSANTIIKYINMLGDELKTSSGYKYSFKANGNTAQVTFDNNFYHTVGNSVTISPGSTLDELYTMLGSVGLMNYSGAQNHKSVTTELGFTSSAYGNYSDNKSDLFTLNLDTSSPVNFDDLVGSNKPIKVTGKIGGVAFNHADLSISNGVTTIKDGNKTITMTKKTNYNVGTSNKPTGYEIVVNDNGTQKKYFMFKFDDNHTNFCEMSSSTPFITNFKHSDKTFGFDNVKEADKYYFEKEKNITDARDGAKDHYDQYNQWATDASATVDVTIGGCSHKCAKKTNNAGMVMYVDVKTGKVVQTEMPKKQIL